MTLQAPAHAQPTLDERRIRRWLRTWAREWNDPGLAQEATIEVSPRLTRSLGKAYPQRTLIRLNPSLLDPKDDRRLKEVACHEAAHLAVYRRFGRAAQPHGPEWQRLVELAGFEPAATFKASRPIPREALCRNRFSAAVYAIDDTRCRSYRVARDAT
jgi:predicted SprT family Zn-dependent metalloprotease